MLLMAALLVPLKAVTAEEVSGPYVGVKLGMGQINTETSYVSSYAPRRTDKGSDKAFAAGFFAGYSLTPNWGLEAALSHMGKYSVKPGSEGEVQETVELPMVSASLTGRLPLNERMSAVAKLGAAYVHATHSRQGTSVYGNGSMLVTRLYTSADRQTRSSWRPVAALALDWQLNRHCGPNSDWTPVSRRLITPMAAN